MHKIIALVLISTTLFCADEVGREFVQLRQAKNETRTEYLERILPLAPTSRKFLRSTLNGEYITYNKDNTSIEVKLKDIEDARKYIPSLYDRLLPFLQEERPNAKRNRFY